MMPNGAYSFWALQELRIKGCNIIYYSLMKAVQQQLPTETKEINFRRFRADVVESIFTLWGRVKQVFLESVFQAICILDEFFACCARKKHLKLLYALPPAILATVCIEVANESLFSFPMPLKQIAEIIGWKGEVAELRCLIKPKMFEVLEEIDFNIPQETALTCFQEEEVPREMSSKKRKCLGVMCYGLKYSSFLSRNPHFGSRIRANILSNHQDDEVEEYIAHVREWVRKKTHQQDLSSDSN